MGLVHHSTAHLRGLPLRLHLKNLLRLRPGLLAQSRPFTPCDPSRTRLALVMSMMVASSQLVIFPGQAFQLPFCWHKGPRPHVKPLSADRIYLIKIFLPSFKAKYLLLFIFYVPKRRELALAIYSAKWDVILQLMGYLVFVNDILGYNAITMVIL